MGLKDKNTMLEWGFSKGIPCLYSQLRFISDRNSPTGKPEGSPKFSQFNSHQENHLHTSPCFIFLSFYIFIAFRFELASLLRTKCIGGCRHFDLQLFRVFEISWFVMELLGVLVLMLLQITVFTAAVSQRDCFSHSSVNNGLPVCICVCTPVGICTVAPPSARAHT